MFINVLNNFKTRYKSQLDSQSEDKNTKLFWKEMEGKYVKIRETYSDIEYPETEGLDGYDVMESIKKDGWTLISIIGDWPYSIFLYKGNQLLHYIEGDMIFYEFR